MKFNCKFVNVHHSIKQAFLFCTNNQTGTVQLSAWYFIPYTQKTNLACMLAPFSEHQCVGVYTLIAAVRHRKDVGLTPARVKATKWLRYVDSHKITTADSCRYQSTYREPGYGVCACQLNNTLEIFKLLQFAQIIILNPRLLLKVEALRGHASASTHHLLRKRCERNKLTWRGNSRESPCASLCRC